MGANTKSSDTRNRLHTIIHWYTWATITIGQKNSVERCTNYLYIAMPNSKDEASPFWLTNCLRKSPHGTLYLFLRSESCLDVITYRINNPLWIAAILSNGGDRNPYCFFQATKQLAFEPNSRRNNPICYDQNSSY